MRYWLNYYRTAARGHLWRPWMSPYLRWRFETFFGVPAEKLTALRFIRLSWRERRRFRAFLRWSAEMQAKEMQQAD